jgi:peptide/nickel transport system permease protein
MEGEAPGVSAPQKRLIRWLVLRALQAIATLLAALVVIFFLMRVLPGDPVPVIIGERQVSPEEITRIRARHCLDCPLPGQFLDFVRDAARGDLGTSIRYNRPVTQLIREHLRPTLLLGATVLLINFTLGVALGAWQGVRKGRLVDRLLSGFSLLAYALPTFWLAIILVWIFPIKLGILPSTGFTSVDLPSDAGLLTTAWDIAAHLVLPVVTLCIVSIAATMRYQRNAMIEVLRTDYVRTARAKGLPERQVLIHHAWRNAVFPVLTIFGLWLPILATGSVFVESIFSLNGLGLLAFESIGYRDYPLLMGSAILVSSLIVFGGFLTDLGYMMLDPRVRRP